MSMCKDKSFDVVVIGSGPGGEKAAVQAAQAGLRVAIVEREPKPGGACVYHGTIPSKTLREAALTIDRLKRHATVFDFNLREGLEVSSLMTRLDHVLQSHSRMIDQNLNHHHITRYHGRGRLVNSNQIEVLSLTGQSQSIHADTIVIATGSRPRTPPAIPVDHEHILDSDSILSMIYLPRSLTVLGGGVIACEYASIFSLLGVQVTLIDKTPRPLNFLDPELTDKFLNHFERHGGRYLGSREIQSVQWDGLSQVNTSMDGGELVRSDKMLVALGRVANIEGLGLKELNIELSARGHVQVNEHFQTNLPNIYAVGDVIGPPALAACSMEQGRRAICHALGTTPVHGFELVPIGIYAVPEMASVGLTEDQARTQFGSATVGRACFEEVARGQISGIEDGLLKLVADPAGDKLLGVQIVGDLATDLIHVGEMALLNRNPVRVFLENILNFPTLGEAYRVAALDLVANARIIAAPPVRKAA